MSLLMSRFKENLSKHKDKTLANEARTSYSSKTGIDVFDYRNGKVIQPDGHKPYLSLGLDEGTYMMFIGRSGGGKTSLAIQMASNIVKPFENGQIIHFDIEQATEMSRIKKLTGWDNETLRAKYMLKNTDIYHETIMSILNEVKHVKDELRKEITVETDKLDMDGNPISILPPTVVILDSLAVLQSRAKLKEDSEELGTNMAAASSAKDNASFFRQIMGFLKSYNIYLFVINHLVDKIDINPYQAPKVRINYLGQTEATVGGNTPLYLANVLVKVDPGSKLTEDKEYGITGFMSNLHIIKSRTNRAGQVIELVFDQEKGIDNIYSTYHHLKKEGYIGGTGRGYFLKNYPDVKFSQKDFKKKLKEDIEMRKAFAKLAKSALLPYVNKEYDPTTLGDDTEEEYESTEE